MRRRIPSLPRWRAAIGVACLVPGSVLADQVRPVDRPLSPGSVALLIAGDVGSAELARWAEALTDARPEVRATAARAAFASGASSLVPALLNAVGREADGAAAREELVALGALAPGQADDALLAAARRFEGALYGPLARSLGRRGPTALALAPRLGDLPLSAPDWKAFFLWSTREGTQELAAAADAALATGKAAAWAGLVAMAQESGETLDDAMLARAVRSGSSAVRADTYWHLLREREQGKKPGPPTQSALDESPEAKGEGEDPVALIAFELLGRALGRRGRDRTALIEGLSGEEIALRLPTDTATLKELEGSERTAYGEARFGDPDGVKETLKGGWQEKSARKRARRDMRMRTASDFPPGLATDVLARAGCDVEKLEPIRWVGLEASYDGEGTLKKAGVFPMEGLSPTCQTAARVLLLMAFRPFDRAPRPHETDVIVLPLAQTFFSCVAERRAFQAGSDERSHHGGRITPPKKVHNVDPRYPDLARKVRREGTVILEAWISRSGCMRSVEVVHGPALDLEGAAIKAVTFWRYTPALLAGKPVPTLMTVTVDFRLQ
jgi:TonB family protein